MPILLALAAAVASPQPGELKTFRDWTVGCDNGRACQAVGLLPEDDVEGATITVQRDAGADAVPKITINSDVKATGLAIDDALSVFKLVARDGFFEIARDEAMAFAVPLAKARKIALVDAKGAPLATISLAGASAAFRYIDDRQRRVGTVTALVAKGPTASVPSPPTLPVITVPPVSPRPPRTLSVARVTQLIGPDNAKCDYSTSKVEPEAYRLDGKTSLVTVVHPCGNGAYNYFSSAFLVDEMGKVRPATFDTDKPDPQDGENIGLVNAGYDPKSRRLSSFMKGRGLGDCGSGQDFVWDGSRFRLVAQTEMGECRGSVDYITTWRARIVTAVR
jgi:Protein of unknown function (DUF1176)